MTNAIRNQVYKKYEDRCTYIDSPLKTMIKQVIIVRNDLKMRKGKLASQVAHASLACVLNLANSFVNFEGGSASVRLDMTKEEYEWAFKSSFKKIVLKVESEEELLNIYNIAKEKGLNVSLIKDRGDTVFTEPTYTTVGIGPHLSEKIDEITKDLKLMT